MEIPFITTISLIWLIYTFIFSDIDKLMLDTLNRLKFALSINIKGNNSGAVNLPLLQVHERMGIPEIIDYGEKMNSNDKQTSKLIKTFGEKYYATEKFKNILLLNLFILTCQLIASSFFCINIIFMLQVHAIISLFLGAVFYWYSRRELSSLVFSSIEF